MIKTGLLPAIALLLTVFTGCKEPEKAVVACINTSVNTAKVGTAIKFTNCSTDAEVYHWVFSDSTNEKGMEVQHTFDAAGIYTVSLIAKGETGWDTAEVQVVITNSTKQDFISGYFAKDECNTGDYEYEIEIKPGSADNAVVISNFAQSGDANAIISGDSLVIPQQTFAGKTLSGTGTITASLLRINVRYTLDNRSCLCGWNKK